MPWIKRLERYLEPFAIPHLTLYLVAGQTFVYLSFLLGLLDPAKLMFVPALVMQGEVWRLLTFLFFPPAAHWVLIAFALYFLYFTGSALEQYWGMVRYNLFIFCGYVLTVGLAFVNPEMLATNIFIGGAIFLAFAYLNPDYVIYVLLILPVKVKWLALLAWIGYAFSFVTGGPATKLSVLAAVGNFLLFFGRDLWLDLKVGQRRAKAQLHSLATEKEEAAPRHRCHVCGKDSTQHPELDFRYCSKCAGDQCYCPEHIRNHEHVLTAHEQAKG